MMRDERKIQTVTSDVNGWEAFFVLFTSGKGQFVCVAAGAPLAIFYILYGPST